MLVQDLKPNISKLHSHWVRYLKFHVEHSIVWRKKEKKWLVNYIMPHGKILIA